MSFMKMMLQIKQLTNYQKLIIQYRKHSTCHSLFNACNTSSSSITFKHPAQTLDNSGKLHATVLVSKQN